tara:strand:- start:8806 stop:12561 length:3756 start_codon:yes stop_codon:yes gene_type:complete
MLLRSIKNLDFGSITLEVSRKEEDPNSVKRMGIVNASLVQSVSRVAEMDEELEGLRIRIVASYSKKSSQLIDFATQRVNEYLLMSNTHRVDGFNEEYPSDEYVEFLQESLGVGGYVFNESQPMSPYSTQRTLIPQMFRNQFSNSGVMEGTIYYDVPVLDHMPRNEDGEIIRRSAVDTNVGTGRSLSDVELIEFDEESGRSRFWSETSIEQITRNPTHNMQRVHLDPVVFDFSGLTEGDLEQLTFYMFVYDADFAPPGDNFELPEISLVTGMSAARTATVIGDRYAWPRITRSNPLRGPGPQLQDGDYTDMTTVRAPQAIIFQRIDLSPQNVFIERVNSVFDRVYGSLSRTILDSKPEIRKIIKKDNYFSDFWIAKDSDENNRFMFAFDIESCLAKNSYFPFLYRSKKISTQLINGTGLMEDPDSEPSKVLRMNVIRRSVSKDATRAVNDLDTSGRAVETGPDTTFPEKVVGEATPVPNVYLTPENSDGVQNKIIFFEGKDQFGKFQKYGGHKGSQINANFVYGAEYVVYDGAPIFMRNMIKYLLARKTTVSDIFDTIVNSVPTPGGYSGGVVSDGRDLYNPKRMTLNVPLNRIKGIIDGEAQMFDSVLLKAAFEYQELLDDLNPFAFEGDRINIALFFRDEFSKNNGLIDPLVIKDLEKLMDVGIQIIYRKLTEIFPNDPLGRGLAFDQDSKLQRRGFCQRKVPLITDKTIFNKPVPKGESLDYGTDYVFVRERNREQFGLSRISLTEYENRVMAEFEKYFSSIDDRDIAPIESYMGPAYAYMTSNVIRTPGRNTMYVPAAGSSVRPTVRYDLNEYAQLFADISNMKFSVDNRQINPVIVDDDPHQTPNNILYESVMKALEEQHCVEFSSTPTPQYNPPKISTGKFPPTTENATPGSGMFIFRNGPLAIPSIIGGANNTDPSVLTYMENANSSLSDTSASKRPGNEAASREQRRLIKRPIKLPFAIFGELTVDSDIDPRFIRYEDIPFNSLKEFVTMIGLTDESLTFVLQDTPVANLPNQVKSAMIIATTQQSNRFGNERIQFDACRPILSDQDPGNTTREENMLISFSKNDPNEPPYPATYDPTKIYAKFLTFWLNYKQIARIEYLDGFNNLAEETEFSADVLTVSPVDNSRLEKTKLPQWRLLSQRKIADAVKIQQNLLCRVRLMSPLDYIKILSHYKKPVLDLVQEYFERKETLELPMYNEYFLLGLGETDQPEEENPEKYPEGYFDDPEVKEEAPAYGFVTGYKGPM